MSHVLQAAELRPAQTLNVPCLQNSSNSTLTSSLTHSLSQPTTLRHLHLHFSRPLQTRQLLALSTSSSPPISSKQNLGCGGAGLWRQGGRGATGVETRRTSRTPWPKMEYDGYNNGMDLDSLGPRVNIRKVSYCHVRGSYRLLLTLGVTGGR